MPEVTVGIDHGRDFFVLARVADDNFLLGAKSVVRPKPSDPGPFFIAAASDRLVVARG